MESRFKLCDIVDKLFGVSDVGVPAVDLCLLMRAGIYLFLLLRLGALFWRAF